ncbi:hypothetical protein BD779DRAFT_256512 [Infundibulicybe gibba]|nr:hypothetical protein BD779DRAFT_256512 [Infundibulicybe gibba]
MRQPLQIIEAADPTREDARRLIDQEIFALEDCARKLKTRRNLISPINQLPPETLSRIFAFCVTQSITWVRSVTHICRLWRDIALDSPQVWGTMVTIQGHRTHPWLEEVLRRSKMANLSVAIHRPTLKQISSIVKTALSHTEHIATLRIELTGRANNAKIKQMFALLESSAPILSFFSLRSRYIGSYSVPIPDNIFNGETPSLRQVELRGYYPNWSSSMLHNLTSLKILANTGTQPTTEQLILILKSSCYLQQLELINCLPTEGDIAILPKRVDDMILEHLIEFRISSTALGCMNILNRISLRPGTKVWVGANCGKLSQPEDSGVQLGRFFSSLASSLDPKATPFQKLLIRARSRCVVLQMMAELPPASAPMDDHYDFSVSCSLPPIVNGNGSIRQQVLTSAFQSISFRNVVRLQLIGCDDAILPATWFSCLREMPILRSISIINGAYNLFVALRMDLEFLINQEKLEAGLGRGYDDNPPRMVVLPELQTIHVNSVDFSRSYNGTQFAELLIDLFIERYERGAVLHGLSLSWCRCIYQTHVGDLEEVIGAVHWDGLGLPADDSDSEYSDEYGSSAWWQVNSDDEDSEDSEE